MNTIPNRSTPVQYAWPLPGTLLPNGHITWNQWISRQANGTIAYQPEREPSSHAGGAWSREVRLVIVTAAAHGVTLREEDLLHLAVHDLQAPRKRIANRYGAHHGHRPRGRTAA